MSGVIRAVWRRAVIRTWDWGGRFPFKDKAEVKGYLFSANICETLHALFSLVLIQLEDDEPWHCQFYQLTVVHIHEENLSSLVLPLSPAN